MLTNARAGAIAGLMAAAAMIATPAAAADLPTTQMQGGATHSQFEQSRYDGETDIAKHHRRWGSRGWYRHPHRHRVDAGDVLAGVLIIGGIAAIASAANDRKRDRYRDYDYRRTRDYDRDYDRRDRRRSTGSSGLDSAVDQCVSRIERDVRVESVDGVDRTAEGWNVRGSLYNGDAFTCRIGNDGRIEEIDIGGYRGSAYEAGDTTRARGDDLQWSDASYIAARERVGQQAPTLQSDEPLPAYPGGPLPGEQASDNDLGG
ncbi:hypothetical protein [Erythrobacter sp. THAF29]|uniref:hypothetical protein n=1 Tax=Erythrobacter sp. THAF29 TaxID=2587851 RepID=UPI0012679325|nr:hypothetical protein [Erythrobacter sp. THAF29]QFT78247.1 hypothetical protein FIU90_11920 [Erythrobacter sp. THAF29]